MQNENDYIIRRYLEFYQKNGYLPEFFNPYNCAEVQDISVTLMCSCASMASALAIMEIEPEFLESHKELFRGFSDG